MKNKKVIWVIQTVLLLVLAVLVQLLSRYIPAVKLGPFTLRELISDTLVSFILIISAFVPGLSSAVIAALASPVAAAVLGIMPGNLPQMVPALMAGNLVIVFIPWLCFRASHGLGSLSARILNIIGIAAGALLKAFVSWAATEKIIVPVFKINKELKAELTAMPMPQFVTGVAGGIIALLVMPAIKAYSKKKRK